MINLQSVINLCGSLNNQDNTWRSILLWAGSLLANEGISTRSFSFSLLQGPNTIPSSSVFNLFSSSMNLTTTSCTYCTAPRGERSHKNQLSIRLLGEQSCRNQNRVTHSQWWQVIILNLARQLLTWVLCMHDFLTWRLEDYKNWEHCMEISLAP